MDVNFGSDRGMEFCEKLVFLIERRCTTQEKLARETRISQSAISNFSRRKQRPYLDQGLRLARALGVSLDYLADDTKDEDEMPTDLTPDEIAVLTAYRASRISAIEAVRALMNVSSRPPGPTATAAREPIVEVNPRDRIRPVETHAPMQPDSTAPVPTTKSKKKTRTG